MKTKLLYIFFLALLTSSSLAQNSGVLDASVVNERFFITRSSIDIGFDLSEYTKHLLYFDSLQLTPEIEAKLKDGQRKWNLKATGLTYCYLFDEQHTWALRSYRIIDLSNPKNEYFIKGARWIHKVRMEDGFLKRDTIFYESESFLNIIEDELKRDYVTPYQFPYFEYDTTFKNTINIDSISETIKFLKIKEDWRYDKENGKLKSYPIGLALLDEAKNEVVWFYYPELRYGLYHRYVKYEFPEAYSASWTSIIENHLYMTESIRLEHHRNHQLMHHHNDDDNEHRNEFNSLFEIELINNHIRMQHFNKTGIINEEMFDGRIISGRLENGVKKGLWLVKYKNGKTSVEIEFINNQPQGLFVQKSENGTTIIKGNFKQGLKTGTWLSYFNNGQVRTERNFQFGMLEGKQQTWHSDGQKHLTYSYKNYKLNGLFERRDTNGVATEKGLFKDDYFIGNWSIALKLSDIQKELIKTNPNHNWGFEVDAVENGYLDYSVKIEQITDMNYCAVNTCLKQISISEIK